MSFIAEAQRQVDYFGAVIKKDERLQSRGPDIAQQTSAPYMQTPMRPLRLLLWPPESHLNYYLPSLFFPREHSWSTCQLTTRDQLQQTGVSVSGKLPGAGFVRDQGKGCGAGAIRYACEEGLWKCGVSQLTHSASQSDSHKFVLVIGFT